MYTQALFGNVKEIFKLKNNFSNFSFKKIKDIYMAISNLGKIKSCINITTKNSSCKQIISMKNNNSKKFMKSSDNYITNLNCALKNIKSDTIIDFIYIDHCSLIVIANKVVIPSKLYMVENYIKNTTFVDLNGIQFACLLQFKKQIHISFIVIISFPSY